MLATNRRQAGDAGAGSLRARSAESESPPGPEAALILPLGRNARSRTGVGRRNPAGSRAGSIKYEHRHSESLKSSNTRIRRNREPGRRAAYCPAAGTNPRADSRTLRTLVRTGKKRRCHRSSPGLWRLPHAGPGQRRAGIETRRRCAALRQLLAATSTLPTRPRKPWLNR